MFLLLKTITVDKTRSSSQTSSLLQSLITTKITQAWNLVSFSALCLPCLPTVQN